MSTHNDDLARIEALVREGDQKISGEILALRTRLVEVSDAVAELRERAGLPAVAAPRGPAPARDDAPKDVDALRIPLVDLARRLEQATASVRDMEAFRSDLAKAGEAIGERVGARAEKSFRRLEESFSAMRMQLDSVAQQVRARPEAEFAASMRDQMEHAANGLRDDVVALGEDLRAEVTQLAEDLRREVAVEVTKELEELREPVRALREHAAALRQISGLDELAADLASVSKHLEAMDARIASIAASPRDEGARAAELLAAAEERFAATIVASHRQILLALESRGTPVPATGESGFLESFGEGVADEHPQPRRRLFGRRRTESEAPESELSEEFFSGVQTPDSIDAPLQTEDFATIEDAHDTEVANDAPQHVTEARDTARKRRARKS